MRSSPATWRTLSSKARCYAEVNALTRRAAPEKAGPEENFEARLRATEPFESRGLRFRGVDAARNLA